MPRMEHADSGVVNVLQTLLEIWAFMCGPVSYAGYFAIQSGFVLGSVWFARYSFIKSIVAILLFILIEMLFYSGS